MSAVTGLSVGTPVMLVEGLFRIDQWDPLRATPINAPFYPKGETGTVATQDGAYLKGSWRVSVRMDSDGAIIALVPIEVLEEL